MIPTDAIMATAVVSAPASTAVRRSEPFMLRAASIASTPSTLRSMPLADAGQAVHQRRHGERRGSHQQQRRRIAE